ncbi:MAG: serine hydrolase domain-containing protein [Candidatus Promineifilaceae bacterium]
MTNPESVGLSTARLDRIRTAVGKYIDDSKIAGAVTLVARRGELVHLESTGWQDRESQTPMQTDSIFRIYSMTKPITCTAAMMLYEEGHFALTDPLAKFLPAFADVQVYVSGEGEQMVTEAPLRPITIRDLFTHTSGLSYHFTEYGYVDQLYRDTKQVRDRPLADFVADAAKLPLAFHPGTKWRYSIAHDVLAHVVEVISGQSFDQFLQERLLTPLGMVDTGFYVPEENHDRFTTMYGSISIDETDTSATRWFGLAMMGQNQRLNGPKDSGQSYKHDNLRGGSGLVSTAQDYWRFAQMLLNNGVANGQRFLSRKTIELMRSNHLASALMPYELNGIESPGQGFGLGMTVTVDVGLSQVLGSVGDYGWGGAANTSFWIDPQEELIGVIMTQHQPSSFFPSSADFRTTVYQAIVD